jgi:hypothetical protein
MSREVGRGGRDKATSRQTIGESLFPTTYHHLLLFASKTQRLGRSVLLQARVPNPVSSQERPSQTLTRATRVTPSHTGCVSGKVNLIGPAHLSGVYTADRDRRFSSVRFSKVWPSSVKLQPPHLRIHTLTHSLITYSLAHTSLFVSHCYCPVACGWLHLPQCSRTRTRAKGNCNWQTATATD